MVNFTILAGGYTSFVVSYLFNSDASTLTVLNQSPTGANPSWISLHPTNKSILYAVNENDDGVLQSFTIGPQGALTGPIGQISTGGGSPAFESGISASRVAVMNYNTGNGKIVPTSADGLQFSDAPVITFPAEVSHPHMALEHGNEVFVPDLGADKVWRLIQDGAPGNFKIQGFIQQPAGSGPRHITVRNNMLFTVHELSSTVTQQAIPPAPNGTASLIANLSILPPTIPAGSAFAGGEILLREASPRFPQPFLYVSNRNTGTQDPRGDTIAIFALEPKLHLVKQVYTGIDQIRGMEFGGPEGEFLVAAGVAGSAGTMVFRRTNGGADLELVTKNLDFPTRTSFVWLN